MNKYLVFLPDRIIMTTVGSKADADRNLLIEADSMGLVDLDAGRSLEFHNSGDIIAVFAPGNWTMVLEYETAMKISEAAKSPPVSEIIKK